MTENETAVQLLDAAQDLVQQRSFNAFSYKDLAEAVGIRTASIHYHFQTKADLGEALMRRYYGQLEAALSEIDSGRDSSKSKLRKFIGLYRTTQKQGAICLCGSMASDLNTLSDSLRAEVAAYLDRSEQWVSQTLRTGVRAGEFTLSGSATGLAATLIAGLQGGLILARAQGPDSSALSSIERSFLSSLETG